MAKGGVRPNAGRPKGRKNDITLEREAAQAFWRRMVEMDVAVIYAAMRDKALEGDPRAAKEMLDRAWGKAHQSVDLTSKGEKIGDTPSTDLQAIASRAAELLKQETLEHGNPD